MRLLYFTRDYTVHDHRFLSALAQTDVQLAYLTLERRGHATEDRSLPPQVEMLRWTGGQKPAALRDGPRLLLDFQRVLRRVKPDILLAGPIQRTALLAALAGFRPLVSMSWGYDLIHDARRGRLWDWATRFTLRRSAALVGDSAIIRQLAVSYGMDDARIVTFPWGVDLQHFAPALTTEVVTTTSNPRSDNLNLPTPRSDDFSRSTFTLLSTRGWEPIYGVDLIAKAFVLAAQQRPELRLVMLGNGSQAGLLRQIFQRGGVEDRVFFPGQVGQSDLPRFYHNADLYVSASHSDGASISLLEALACGKPALVSDIPGNREWVTPGENGWWFPDGDEEALAQGMLHAAGQGEHLAQMGQAARRSAEARADWQKNFPQLLHAFEIALASRA